MNGSEKRRREKTKMIRLHQVGGDQEQQPPDLTTENGIQGENTEIPSLRESAPKPTIKPQESSTKASPVEDVEQDSQNQRRTSHRLLTVNRNDPGSSTSTTSSSPRSINGQGSDNNRGSEQSVSTTVEPSSTSIICSLPLNRLESILGMLNIIQKSPMHAPDPVSTDEALRRVQDRSNVAVSAGSDDRANDVVHDNSSLAYKVLCLYCDRSFSSQKLMMKHTDRIHRIAKERRSSARVLSTALNGTDISSCCQFCHKSKTLNLMSENLLELFKHLISVHSDRYYACEHCTLRFPTDEARETHMEALHPSTNNGRPKSKAALKAFSHSQSNCTLHHHLHHQQQQPVVSIVNCKALKTGIATEANESSSSAQEPSSKTMDRLGHSNRAHSSNTKGGESATQNVCLRSSLRNANAGSVADKEVESGKSNTKAFKKSERLLRRNSEPMLLSRLGITQHRLPRQSRRLLAAASANVSASLLSSDTSLSASSASSTSSVIGPCLGKFSAKKKGLILANDEGHSVQNCYNKITKLKTIRSTLNTNATTPTDGTGLETVDSNKSSAKPSDGSSAIGNPVVTSTGPIGADSPPGLNSRGAMSNSSIAGNITWSNSTSGVSGNAISTNAAVLVAANNGVFDEDFYETVTQNVKNNLSCHLDGKLEAHAPGAPSPMSPVAVVPAVRSTVVKSPVSTESKIHEATNLPAISVMFPTLLTVEQYGTDPKPTTSSGTLSSLSSTSLVKTKKPVTKNSWKWKWDFVKKYKYVNENGRIVKKIKQPTIGLRDLSKLDMWTQLTMRTKHELFQHRRGGGNDQQRMLVPRTSCASASAKGEPILMAEVGAALRNEKRAMVEQLDHILDARLLPHIDLEQNDQRIIKIEPVDQEAAREKPIGLSAEPVDDKAVITLPQVQSSSLVPWSNHQSRSRNVDFLQSLQLVQLNDHYQKTPVVLSGEWARPRCYICYGCGAKFNSLKQVEEHRIFRHPHVHSTFYEIVGRELIEKRLYKHFFIPFVALMMHRWHCMRLSNPERIMNSAIQRINPQHTTGACRINAVAEIKNEDSSSNEATSLSTSTRASSSSSRHSTNTTVTTLMDTCSDTMNVLTQCSMLAIDDDDDGSSSRSVICSKCQKECQNQMLLYAHILHCSNDYVWLQAKKRMKYRRAKRRRGGNRNGVSCAPSMLTIPRLVQPPQNVLEKVETGGYLSLYSSPDEKHVLNGVTVSNSSTNNISTCSNTSSSSNDSTGSSGSSSSNSNTSNDSSKVNGNQKARKSPKPKESDSDIVKKLLANLPAKRNSRQTNFQTSKQITKRSKVVGRKSFCSATVTVTTKQIGHGTKLVGESVVAQPTTQTATAPVHNGNNIDSNKILSTSLISSTKQEKTSHGTGGKKLRSRQNMACSLPSVTNAMNVTSNKTLKTVCKKTTTTLEESVNDANSQPSSKESLHILEKSSETRKQGKINRGKLGVGTVKQKQMVLWKKSKHQLLRVTTTNGHHRMLRSNGKRLLHASVSSRRTSLPLRSVRNPTRVKNVLKNRKILRTEKQIPSAVTTVQAEAVDKKESTSCDRKDDASDSTADNVDSCVDCEPDTSGKIDSLSKAATFTNVTPLEPSVRKNETEERNSTIVLELTVDNTDPLLPAADIEPPESLASECSATQLTPNQPIRKQYTKDPPATPTKCDLTPEENVVASESFSSYSTIVEQNNSTSCSQWAGGSKRRKKKLNDCIAMLTGKLSERLGVDFFNNEKNNEEISQNESSAASSMPEAVKFAANNTTTSSSYTVSSDESSLFMKHAELVEFNSQQLPNHASCPVASTTNPKLSSATVSEPTDVLPVSAAAAWSNNYCHALPALPPQPAPVRLKTVCNIRPASPNLVTTPLTYERLATHAVASASKQIMDEPLNLSKNCLTGSGVIRNAKVQRKTDDASSSMFKTTRSQPQESLVSSNPSAQPLHTHNLKAEIPIAHFNQPLGTSPHLNQQKVRHIKCSSPMVPESGCTVTPKVGGGNFSSLKLPPGLIIERVEYKQSRPSITKEVPSVTIVARQRQLPAPEVIPSVAESSATDLTMEKPASITHSSNLTPFPNSASTFIKPIPNSTSGVMVHHGRQDMTNHTKIIGYGGYPETNVLSRRCEPTTDNLSPMCFPPTLRSGPCPENRISVTITESSSIGHDRAQDLQNPSTCVDLSATSHKDKVVTSYCTPSPLDSTPIRASQRMASTTVPSSLLKASIGPAGHVPGSSVKTPPPMTTLIIPQVPMPPLVNQTVHALKRARRKSVFVPLPVPTDESNRDVMAKPLIQQHPIIPTIGSVPSSLAGTAASITGANLLASMSLSFIAPSLLPVPGTSMLSPIDMQRLAAVRLPAHLQPPVIPPLKIPDPATSASLLEKMFHPTPSDVLSTGLELKPDAQSKQPKQPSVPQLTAIRSNMNSKPAEENSHFISSKSLASVNGFITQPEHQIKTSMPATTRTEGTRTSDTKISKQNNNSSGAACKGSGRIMKRRASVADLQRKALMEQIWNQSIIDKMMNEKDTRIVSGLDEAKKTVDTSAPTAESVLEKKSNVENLDQRIAHLGEQITTIAEKSHIIHPSTPSCAPTTNKTERQNKNKCPIEIDSITTNLIKIPDSIAPQSVTLRQHADDMRQHNTVIVPLNNVQEVKERMQVAQQECNVQPQTRPEEIVPQVLTLEKFKDSNTTFEHEQHTSETIKEAVPPAPLSTINGVDAVPTIDKVDAASEDGSADTADCRISNDQQKQVSKKIVRKRRKNELASILSDQLLESFKEVDKSRLDDLKLLHDLTCETPDVKFTLEQIPQLAKRKSNPRMPELLMQDSPKLIVSVTTSSKKVNNTKKLTKDKDSVSQPTTVKEPKTKSASDTLDCSEQPTTSKLHSKIKSFPLPDEKKQSVANSSFDSKEKCTDKPHADGQENIEKMDNSMQPSLVVSQKATRTKTLTSITGEQKSHNTPKKTSTRLINSESDVAAAHDETDDITIQDRKTVLRKRVATPATEEQQAGEKNNSKEKIVAADSNTRPTESVAAKSAESAAGANVKSMANLPKRIMARRKSVFVDCDLAQYVEKEENKLKKEAASVSFKDDFMLTSRRGTRSQAQLGLDLAENFPEAAMKPRDPRRRILLKRREEELNARENKIQQAKSSGTPLFVEKQTIGGGAEKQVELVESHYVDNQEKKALSKQPNDDVIVDTKSKNDEKEKVLCTAEILEHAPLRRISARRASVCVRPLPNSKTVKEKLNTIASASDALPLPEDERLRDIGNEVKRIYKRRASIYQPSPELHTSDACTDRNQSNRKERQTLNSIIGEENAVLGRKKETMSQKSPIRRSKTPGPSDWKRRNQLPLNGTSEPLIESLLLHATDSESNAPKRRTTKNSQIAETVSKLFNIQEEIMLIDSSRRKPRKTNTTAVSTEKASIRETPQQTLDKTNSASLEKANDKCKTLSGCDLPKISDEPIEKKSLPQLPRKSFSFSNDEDESPKAIKKLVENIINNTTNSSNASTDYSDDDNMSLACFAARRNMPITHSQQSVGMFAKPPSNIPARAMSVIGDDESTTNTDALDDDMMSVTTEIPTSTNATRRVRRKRRKTRRQNSKIKRQQAKTQEENNKPVQSFNCNLCRKMFKKQDAYNKHRMTLSHIAKLSEQEYLDAQKNQARRQDDALRLTDEKTELLPKTVQQRQDNQIAENPMELDVPAVIATTPDSVLSRSLAMTDKSKNHDDQAVKELSQEEKLFFECCSMLKESNSSENDKLKRVTVSLKSSELISAIDLANPCAILTNEGNNVPAPVTAVHLPLIEQNQILPVSTTCCAKESFETAPVTVIQQEDATFQQNHGALGEDANFMVHRYVLAKDAGSVSPHNSIKSSSAMSAATGKSSTSSSSSSSTSSSSSASSRSSTDSNSINKSNANNAKIKTKGALKGYDNFKVSIPMTGLTVMSTNTASTGIGAGKESRLDTLADVALCGDIPKEFGIAVQCDDISATTTLEGGDEGVHAPSESFASFPVVDTDMFLDAKVHVPSLTSTEKNEFVGVKSNSTISRNCEENSSKSMISNRTGSGKNRDSSSKSQTKQSNRWTTGPYRRKMDKNNPTLNAETTATVQCDHTFLYEGDDVYAFQDSPCDGDLPSTYSSKKNSNIMQHQSLTKHDEKAQQHTKHNLTTLQTATPEEHEDSQMSSLSFSDRDDFVYGTNTMSEEEEEEEDKNSSISSEQTTPKKLTNADVQKKSLIMGRIFKKGGAKDKLIGDAGLRKCPTISPEANIAPELPHKMAGASGTVAKPLATAKSAVKDFDKLFDTLKNDATVLTNEMQSTIEPEYDTRPTGSCDEEMHGPLGVESKVVQRQANNSDHPGHLEQSEHVANVTGTERLRRRRTGQQKILTETWDSDEFEDFQTDDIMKLIDRTEDEEANDHTQTKKRNLLHSTPEEKVKLASLENKIPDHTKQSLSLDESSTNEKEHPKPEHVGLKRSGTYSLVDKKPSSKSDVTVTDDTIRKVMESVILETMGKNCNTSKRKPTAYSLGLDNREAATASNSKTLRHSSNSDGGINSSLVTNVSTEDVSLALELTSLEEHTLESSVVISSKTITSKFKQKLNSSMRDNLTVTEGTKQESKEKESTFSRPKLSTVAHITTALPETNHTGSNVTSIAAHSKNNNNNNKTNNNNNNNNTVHSKSLAKSSKAVTGTRNRGKPKCTEEDWTGKTTAVTSSKQRKVAPRKMKNIAYDPDSDYEQSIKCKKVKRKLLENDIEANLKIEQLQSTLLNAEDSSILLTTSRRKRNAGDMLYYWSSSSDEEEIDKEEKSNPKNNGRHRHGKPANNNNAPLGKKRGRKRKQSGSQKTVEPTVDGANIPEDTDLKDEPQVKDVSVLQPIAGTMETTSPMKKLRTSTITIDKKSALTPRKKQLDAEKSLQMQTLPVQTEEATCGTSSEHLQQHGWIMGDSHKKLVTMLAHAKGKNDSRKQTTNRKK
ncbi:uncharacterized protein LOC126560703 [Anopheles maculipalpis]|uniref:uncharacterized protein LOC126560703 n=1 Tax=Anopheles maculipalpis TaxID=1496333 RepID=UPI002158F02A|nr:uncharacterized protein LOC126560703 [Anopheles maculipalpis]